MNFALRYLWRVRRSTADPVLIARVDREIRRTCPCRYHRLQQHPRQSYAPTPGLIDLLDLCWCECDHEPDEARWAE